MPYLMLENDEIIEIIVWLPKIAESCTFIMKPIFLIGNAKQKTKLNQTK
jgi:hypothetical protein